jgi:hypothetical protein
MIPNVKYKVITEWLAIHLDQEAIHFDQQWLVELVQHMLLAKHRQWVQYISKDWCNMKVHGIRKLYSKMVCMNKCMMVCMSNYSLNILLQGLLHHLSQYSCFFQVQAILTQLICYNLFFLLDLFRKRNWERLVQVCIIFI